MRTRKELYAEIKALNLAEAAQKKFKKHWTNCSSLQLEELINDAKKSAKTSTSSTKTKVDSTKNTKTPSKKPSMVGTTEAKVAKLVEVLGRKRILLKSELDEICNA